MTEMNRRDFLGTATTAVSGAAAGLAWAHVAGADEPAKDKDRPPVRLAVMGVNGRGRGLLSGFCKFPDVEIAYICDPDQAVLPKAVSIVEGAERKAPKTVADFRVALEDPQVDAIVCAAPDHWHALATIWACQAGKDVYVEKPVCHDIREGEAMVAAARKYGRVVQTGTQRRSGSEFKAMADEIASGRLGKIHMVRTWICSTRPNIGYNETSAPPENLDFDLWCGPAPNRGYKKNLVHYHWHWRWDYGTGECGNNGIHAMDIARWGIGLEYPQLVTCGGGKYSFDDDQETPDTQLATFDYPGGCLQWEHRTWSKRGIDGQDYGIEFYGSDATLIVGNKGWKVFQGEKEVTKNDGSDYEGAHLRNFLDCLASREKPNADIEIGHRSAQLCHLANIAWRTRSTLQFNGEGEQATIANNPEASALLGREYRKGFELPAV